MYERSPIPHPLQSRTISSAKSYPTGLHQIMGALYLTGVY